MIARLNSGGATGAPGPGGQPSGGAARFGGSASPGGSGGGGNAGGRGPGGGGSGMRAGGGGNVSQLLERAPTITLNDIKRGDPIVVFASEGANPSEVTALFILTGVEPILAAQPKGGGDVNLGGWNLSSGGEGGGEGGP